MSARHARNKPDDEDAATIKLGNDFNDQACFNISEVYHLLMVQQEQRGAQDNQVYKKTLEHVKTFARFTGADVIQEVREAIEKSDLPDLKSFEIAQLGTLCPADVDEAKALIPSLADKDDEKLHALLTTLQGLRKFQS